MLGSEEEDPSPPENDMHYHHHHGHRIIQSFSTPPSIHMRQLLISCAELISRSDLSAAHRLTTVLSANSSLFGDSTERLVHQFNKALSLRLHRLTATSTTNTTTATAFFLPKFTNATSTATNLMNSNFLPSSSGNITTLHQFDQYDDSAIQSSYLSLNQITPFIRFTHLTANQAILEAIDGQNSIHILDFDIMHGVQWPPLMQALAERYPPPSLRISGTGNNLDILQRTGDRLAKFAHSLNLQFQFHPIFLANINNPISSLTTFQLKNFPADESETLAVNCISYLHRLNRENLSICLHKIRSMNPKIVTIAEPEANHNLPLFLQRFVESLDYYTAVFHSLEATLPPNSRERLSVEQVWFGREISDIVAAEGENRRERHERFRAWDLMLRSSGFLNVPLSPFALSQAKLLLRLHYPSEGYQVQAINDSFFLGWQNQHLFSVSSWR